MSSMTPLCDDGLLSHESSPSAVSWGAILGGAFAAAAVSLALLLLGSALGLSSLSPWSYPDAESVKSFTLKTAIWLIVMQWVAAALGGYLTGRLRTKWTGVHTDEVFFRDTAHGFLMWAVATVFTASVLASAATSIIGGGVQAGAIVAAGAANNHNSTARTNDANDYTDYYIDMLFRSPTVKADASMQDTRSETLRILATDLKNGNVNDTDKAYLTQLVAARTGISEDEARQRVDDTLNQLNTAKEKAKQDVEEARKAAMHVAVFIFLSMLVGAFIASCAAAIGGRRRDE